MNIIEHTINWYKGEIFEGTLIGLFGAILLVISIVFWRLGKTPNAQAMVIPLLVVGLLLSLTGGFMANSNANKIKTLTESKIENHQEFLQVEKKRVEDFQPLYTYTKIGAALFFTMAIILFFVTKDKHWQAVAIALIILGASGLVIDYFSKERADVYYNQLLIQVK